MNPEKITAAGFIQELNKVLSEMQQITAELKNLEQDTIDNHANINLLNDRFIGACEKLPGVVAYITANTMVPVESVGKLKEAIAYIDEILTQKKRILTNTPRMFIEMNDMSCLN